MMHTRTFLLLTAGLLTGACSSPVATPGRDLPATSAASKQQPGPGEASTTSGGDDTAPTDSAIAGNTMGAGG